MGPALHCRGTGKGQTICSMATEATGTTAQCVTRVKRSPGGIRVWPVHIFCKREVAG